MNWVDSSRWQDLPLRRYIRCRFSVQSVSLIPGECDVFVRTCKLLFEREPFRALVARLCSPALPRQVLDCRQLTAARTPQRTGLQAFFRFKGSRT